MKHVVGYWVMAIMTVLILYEFVGRFIFLAMGVPLPPSVLGDALPFIFKIATQIGSFFIIN